MRRAARVDSTAKELVACACGCGRPLPEKNPWSRHETRFLVGHHQVRNPKRLVPCPRCGTAFKQWSYGRPKYCSGACGKAAGAEKNAAKRDRRACKCLHCGVVFEIRAYRDGRTKFCSRRCAYDARSKWQVASCVRCGAAFPMTPFHQAHGRKYCSKTCYYHHQKMRRHATKDANHNDIARAFERVGASVIHTHAFGKGFPDMLVCYRRQVYLVEVKNPSSAYGRQGLNELQKRLRDEGWPLCVVRTEDEAMRLVLGRRGDAPAQPDLLGES